MIDSSGANNTNFYSVAWEYPAKVIAEYRRQKEQAMADETFTSESEALEAIDQEATDHAIKWLKRHKPQALRAIGYLAKAGWSSDRIIGRIEAKYKDSEPNIQHKMKLVAEWAVRNQEN